jgi:hypothetical protein
LALRLAAALALILTTVPMPVQLEIDLSQAASGFRCPALPYVKFASKYNWLSDLDCGDHWFTTMACIVLFISNLGNH